MGESLASPMMSAEEFTKKLSDSGLLSAAEIYGAMGTIAGNSLVVNGIDLANRFVGAGKITSFQAQAVLDQRLQDLRIGNYEVLARLGSGAMGTVYKARHRRMKRIVAIKVLSPAVARDTFVLRFQREVETLAQLTHPNIVMAFDADEAEAGHFLVMEFVDGRDLASIVQQNGPMPLGEALDAILQAARGLEYAHAKNIIHRDIKPANIMRDAGGGIKVADLGLARLSATADTVDASSLTQAGGIVGTVDYMAPEQAVDSTTIDRRADIYSLGCTLYFLLTAQPPYQGNSIMAILLKHRDGPLPNLRATRSDVPTDLEKLFERMLAKKLDSRIANMAEVVQILEAIKADLARSGEAVPSQQPTARVTTGETTLADESWERLAQPTAAPATDSTMCLSEVRGITDLTVILVEPSRTQAGIVRKYLNDLGIETVHSAGSGKQAIELAKQHGAQALISSMHLADMTGMQLAKLLRADGACAAMGFVLTTSGSEAEDIATLRTMPHTVLMPKPFDAKKLAAALAEATGRSVAIAP